MCRRFEPQDLLQVLDRLGGLLGADEQNAQSPVRRGIARFQADRLTIMVLRSFQVACGLVQFA